MKNHASGVISLLSIPSMIIQYNVCEDADEREVPLKYNLHMPVISSVPTLPSKVILHYVRFPGYL